MLRFDPTNPRKVVSARLLPAVAPLVGVLILVLILMTAARVWFQDETAAESLSNTTGARPLPGQTPVPETDPVPVHEEMEAVELERLSVFVDHRRSMAPAAFYYLLNLATRNPPADIEQAARRDYAMANLLDDPDQYRGQILLLRGRLRRLLEFKANANPYGIERQYNGWLYTEEAGNVPYVIISARTPSIPLAGNMNQSVTVAGYFLGWWRFTTQQNTRTSAPVIMAHRVVPRAAVNLRPDAKWANTYGLAAGVVVLLGLLIGFCWRFQRPRSVTTADRETSQAETPHFDELEWESAEQPTTQQNHIGRDNGSVSAESSDP